MKFCASCGSALEFFEFLDGELCSSCLKKDTQKQAPTQKNDEQPSDNELATSILGVEDNKIVLKSPEGWVLWSGAISEKNQLQTIMTRAQRILQIRKKRNK